MMPNSLKRQRSGLRLPPYGRELLDLRRRGLVPASQIVVSLDSWRFGAAYAGRVVIPADLDPTELCFDFVAGLDCVVVRDPFFTDDYRCDAVLRELLACDPASLRAVNWGNPITWLWVKSRQHGLEKPEYLKT